MHRRPEPELMNDPAQAHAYAHADFSEPHDRFVTLFQETFPNLNLAGRVLDLGCGAADVTVRFARAFPNCVIDAVDGAEHMLAHAAELVARSTFQNRVRLHQICLPTESFDGGAFDVVISNSLLHHLHNPAVLWNTIAQLAREGAAIFIMDLMRPESEQAARMLVNQYAGNEPDILRRDFYNSLLAAFTLDEVKSHLAQPALENITVRTISDRHFLASGYLGKSIGNV